MAVNVKAMDDKKIQEKNVQRVETSNDKVKTAGKRAESYLSEIKSEFSKITWTSKEELKTYTQLVVGATFVCGIGVYGIDLFIKVCLNTLDMVLRWVFG